MNDFSKICFETVGGALPCHAVARVNEGGRRDRFWTIISGATSISSGTGSSYFPAFDIRTCTVGAELAPDLDN